MNSGFAATGQPPSLGKRGVLQRTLEPGPHWRLYCTIRRLPFVARRWRRQATEVSCWKRRRIAYLTPPALGRRQPSQSHNPTGKATHCILSRLRLPTNAVRCAPVGPAKRCPTHNPYAPSIRAACRPATHRHQLDKPQFDYGPFPISASYPIYGIIKSNVLHFLPPGLYQGPSAGRNYEKETCNY